MNHSYMPFYDLKTSIKSLPEARQQFLLDQLVKTYQLGLRSLILRNLKDEDILEFENTFLEYEDPGLLSFGHRRIADFENKHTQLVEEITKVFIKSIHL